MKQLIKKWRNEHSMDIGELTGAEYADNTCPLHGNTVHITELLADENQQWGLRLNHNEKKGSEETQTLHAGCSKAEPNFFALPDLLPRGTGQPKFNQLEMVTTFSYKPSLVRIDARNFQLSW